MISLISLKSVIILIFVVFSSMFANADDFAGQNGTVGAKLPNADDSNYDVSNQINGYLTNQVVKKLMVKSSRGLKLVAPTTYEINPDEDEITVRNPTTIYNGQRVRFNDPFHAYTDSAICKAIGRNTPVHSSVGASADITPETILLIVDKDGRMRNSEFWDRAPLLSVTCK